MSGYDPEQSHRERVEQALDSIDTRLAEPVGDARAQLWRSVYRDELKLWRICLTPRGETPSEARLRLAQGWARKVAAEAVRDFDEHYLRGKR